MFATLINVDKSKLNLLLVDKAVLITLCNDYFRGQVGGVRPIARGRGRTAAGSRSAGGRAYVLNGFLPSLHPLLQASIGGGNNLSQVRCCIMGANYFIIVVLFYL